MVKSHWYRSELIHLIHMKAKAQVNPSHGRRLVIVTEVLIGRKWHRL